MPAGRTASAAGHGGRLSRRSAKSAKPYRRTPVRDGGLTRPARRKYRGSVAGVLVNRAEAEGHYCTRVRAARTHGNESQNLSDADISLPKQHLSKHVRRALACTCMHLTRLRNSHSRAAALASLAVCPALTTVLPFESPYGRPARGLARVWFSVAIAAQVCCTTCHSVQGGAPAAHRACVLPPAAPHKI